MARYWVRLSGSADSSTHDSHPLHTLDMFGSKQLLMRLKNKSNRHRDTKLTTIKAIGNMLDFISKLRTLCLSSLVLGKECSPQFESAAQTRVNSIGLDNPKVSGFASK